MASKFAAFFKSIADSIEQAGMSRAQTYLKLYDYTGHKL
jgi:hypothetical protein